jgi:hypothetical protein
VFFVKSLLHLKALCFQVWIGQLPEKQSHFLIKNPAVTGLQANHVTFGVNVLAPIYDLTRYLNATGKIAFGIPTKLTD